MIRQTFDIVARALARIAGIVDLSYDEINIIVYYAFIPLTWAAMLDRIFGFHYIKIGYSLIVAIVFFTRRDFKAFSHRLFDVSARFLNSFGWCNLDYYAASVVFCVILPLAIYMVLGYRIWLQMQIGK
jgi:hypothetical protein